MAGCSPATGRTAHPLTATRLHMQISSLTHASTTTPRRWTIVLLCACMVLGSMATPDSAHAARKKKSSDTTSEPAQKKGNVKIKHQRSPSEESTAERDRRLYRECKGLPNAGACLGYTRR